MFIIILRVNEKTSKYFLLQRRRGHGESKGLSALLVGTFDSVFDTKPAPFRILHRTPTSDIYYGMSINKHLLLLFYIDKNFYFYFKINTIAEIASALTFQDVARDWEWLEKNIFQVLNEMETEEEITNFTICKIQSLVAQSTQNIDEQLLDSSSFSVVESKFRERFNMPMDEKLVNYYSCK